MNFIPFHSCGLWDAVIEIPPCAFRVSTARVIVGVGAIPRLITSQPLKISAASIIFSISPPNNLPSRPITTLLCPIYFAKAETYFIIFSGKRDFPIIPRIPDIETIGFSINKPHPNHPLSMSRRLRGHRPKGRRIKLNFKN